MSETPIYDQLRSEHADNVPGTFTQDELAILLEARRLCGIPERLALMPTVEKPLSKRRRTAGIVPVRTLRDRATADQDTHEIDVRTLVRQ
jgi:hypothetical protein